MTRLHYVILGAGYGTRLQRGIAADASGAFAGLLGCPKPLLPVGNRALAEIWISQLEPRDGEQIVIVTNGSNHDLFEKLVEERKLSHVRLVCDGSESNDSRLGAVADMALAVKALRESEKDGEEFDVCIIAGDTLFDFDERPGGAFFDVKGLVSKFREERRDSLVCYELSDPTETLKRGILVLNEEGQCTEFLEKPDPSETPSRLACPPFYLFTYTTHSLLEVFLEEKQELSLEKRDSPGRFVQWLVQEKDARMYGRIFGGRRYDIGNLEQYKEALAAFGLHSSSLQQEQGPSIAVGRAFARIGMIGNPSDGYGGACMSFTVRNSYAEVVAHQSDAFRILPGKHDLEFSSMKAFSEAMMTTGIYGGLRLVKAASSRFCSLVEAARERLKSLHDQSALEEGIRVATLLERLELKQTATLQYSSTIPIMVGLAGSSAIVLATIRCLCAFYRIPPLSLVAGDERALPSHVLAAECELGIAAGLQDRVAQVYEGLVYMDFGEEVMRESGYGEYERMPVEWLPDCIFLLHRRPSLSSVVHSNLRERWELREESVVKAMEELREITASARDILSTSKGKLTEANLETLGDLLDRNFDIRASIVGISQDNREMVDRARALGLACKFTGSGGALIALPRPSSFSLPVSLALDRCRAVEHLRELLGKLSINVELVQT